MKEPVFDLLNALSEPIRVRLLCLIEAEELGVGELVESLQLPQSTISRHLKVLQERDLVIRRQAGTASLFRVTAWDPATTAIWGAIRDEVDATRTQDLQRMRTVLALRRGEGQDFFGRYAAQWDGLRQDLFGRDYLLSGILALLPGEQVIADLGCGTGETLALLAPVAARAIGVDREPAMLEHARARGDFDLRVGELDALPIDEDELDIALLVLVLHHVQALAPVFSELRRTLKPGGRALVVDMVEHDREDFQRTMGHQHLGFPIEALDAASGMDRIVHRVLPQAPNALGPQLQLAVYRAAPSD